MAYKTIASFNLPVELVKEIDNKFQNSSYDSRSKFVEKLIEEGLNESIR